MTPLKTAAAVFILSLCAHLFAAQPAEVIFLAGKGTVTEGKITKIAEKGMKLSPDAVIKLEKKSVLTVGIGSVHVPPGTACGWIMATRTRCAARAAWRHATRRAPPARAAKCAVRRAMR